jgi:hypothetical protein
MTATADTKRVALVIGNAAYKNVGSLATASADAADIAAAFRTIGFRVTEEANLGKAQFEAALSKFTEEAAGADMAVIYYAGHGIEINKQNYLIPVDASLATDRQAPFETIPLDNVLTALQDVLGIRMVFLDACRNNPFLSRMKMTNSTRSVAPGPSKIEAADGTVISFSAQEGGVAMDGIGRNSPFAAALLRHINEPGLELQFFLRKIRDEVRAATGGEQSPFISASLPSAPIYLVAPEVGRTTPKDSELRNIPEMPHLAVTSDFASAQQVGTPAAWKAFLAKYRAVKNQSTVFYIELANAALRKAESRASPASSRTSKSKKSASTPPTAKAGSSRRRRAPAATPRSTSSSRKAQTVDRSAGSKAVGKPSGRDGVQNRAELCKALLSGGGGGRGHRRHIGRQLLYDQYCRGGAN